MMKIQLIKIALLFACFLGSSIVSATSEKLEYANLSQVQNLAHKLAKEAPVDSIWLVYDIDNTLLTGVHPIATTEWFDWQLQLIKEKSNSPLRTAKTVEQLVTNQVHIFDWAAMKPIEEKTSSYVNALQAAGYHSMALTARSAAAFPATIRELDNNNLVFAQSSRPLKPQYDYPQELSNSNPILFDKGVMMASGQNKGLLLRHLFYDQKIQARYIIFVDDSLKNVDHMAAAFAQDNRYHVISIHYIHAQPEVIQFEKANKEPWVNDYFEFVNLWDKLRGLK